MNFQFILTYIHFKKSPVFQILEQLKWKRTFLLLVFLAEKLDSVRSKFKLLDH